jgi:hypothetical protein
MNQIISGIAILLAILFVLPFISAKLFCFVGLFISNSPVFPVPAYKQRLTKLAHLSPAEKEILVYQTIINETKVFQKSNFV